MAPKLAQARPKLPLDTLFENISFQTNEPRPRREHDFGDRRGPRSAQDGFRIAPRRSSRASFFIFIFLIDFGAFWVPFWVWMGWVRPEGPGSLNSPWGPFPGRFVQQTTILPSFVRLLHPGTLPTVSTAVNQDPFDRPGLS